MRRSIIAGIGMASLIASLLMLQLTAPSSVGLVGILIFFILLYITCGSFLYVVLATSVQVLGQILPQGKWRVLVESVTITKIYYYSSILALAPVILLGMHSVGSVGVADMALLILFELLACFYISKRF